MRYRRACLQIERLGPGSEDFAWADMGIPCVPLWFVFLEDFPLGVVANDLAVDEATEIQPRGAERCCSGHRE